MAKKKPTAAVANKSDVIRQILAAQPGAKVKDIQTKLNERSVKASVALINKIKYGAGIDKKTRRGSKAGSKAMAIRAMFTTMGDGARPRDVIAALKSKGVIVTSAQVSMLRPATANGNGQSNVANSLLLNHLLAAKQFAKELGGIGKARQALDALARLV